MFYSTEECMKKLACEVAAQDNLSQAEMDNFERWSDKLRVQYVMK